VTEGAPAAWGASAPSQDTVDVARDSAARAAALDPGRSLLLQAPAGSGKTTLLSQRFLRLLAEVAAPEQILAVTFTRKAAAEMRTRIVGALHASESEGGRFDATTLALARAALARSRTRGWDVESNPARLRIQTIDGLNRSLAASLPVGAAAGQSLEVTQRDRQLYLDAARRALLDAESDPAMQAHSDRLLRRLDNHWLRLEGLLADMLARRSHWLRHVAGVDALDLRRRIEQTLAALVVEALEEARHAMPVALRREGLWLAVHAARTSGLPGADALGARDDLGCDTSDLPAWCAVARLALTEQETLRKTLNARNGFPARDKDTRDRALAWLGELAAAPRAIELLAQVLRLPPTQFEPADAAVLESLIVLLRYAAGQLELLFRDVRRVDYVAIAAAARTALGDEEVGTELTIHQGEQLRHLLVDEFQDTSLDQFELLEALTRDWAPGDGRSLFLVGDPMQSIYQFREAEVGLFLRARDAGIGRIALEPLALTRNFRSDGEIVGFVNRCFAAIFPARDDPREAAVRYLPCAAASAREPALAPRVRLRHLPPFDQRAESEAVLEIVRGLRQESSGCSIAVLVSARSHAAPIARALRGDGIAVQGVDLIPLGEVPAVQDLMSLTRVLLDPTDRTAWIGVLRAPWCGLQLEQLAPLLENAPHATLSELLADDRRTDPLPAEALARLAHLQQAIEAARAHLGRAPLAAVVETAWLGLGGAVAYPEASTALDARRFLDAVAEREQSGEWDGVGDLAALVARLYAASDTAAGDAVQVMTIHRAKGLEFDAVILPSLGRARRRGEEPLLSYVEWPDETDGARLLLAPIRAPEADDPSVLGAWIRALQGCRVERERVRLLYVAATRARAALYLLGSLEASVPGSLPAPRHGSLLASLWPAIGLAFPAEPESGGALAAADFAAPAAPQLLRVATPWRRPELAATVGAEETLAVATAELPEAREKILRAGSMNRHVGLVVHDELGRLAGRAATQGVTDAAADLARYRQLLAAQGVEPAALDPMVALVAGAIGRVLADPEGRWLLDARHGAAADALALSGLYEGRFTSVQIDRSFIDARGTRWLIDYRVSPHAGGDVEAFVAAELRGSEPRLRRQIALARALGPEPVRAALYFPLLPRLVEYVARR